MKKRIISIVAALVMCLTSVMPIFAMPAVPMSDGANAPMPGQTIAADRVGIASWFVCENNILWGSGGDDDIFLGHGGAPTTRGNYIQIMDNVVSVFVGIHGQPP
jgi:hypothetical protein